MRRTRGRKRKPTLWRCGSSTSSSTSSLNVTSGWIREAEYRRSSARTSRARPTAVSLRRGCRKAGAGNLSVDEGPYRPNHGMKLLGRKRLREIAIGAGGEKTLAILSHGVRGERDD